MNTEHRTSNTEQGTLNTEVMMNKGIQKMTRVAHIQPTPAWPTSPVISYAVWSVFFLFEEKGLGDEVDLAPDQRTYSLIPLVE